MSCAVEVAKLRPAIVKATHASAAIRSNSFLIEIPRELSKRKVHLKPSGGRESSAAILNSYPGACQTCEISSSGSVWEVSDKLQFVARNDKLKLIGHQTDPLPDFVASGGLVERFGEYTIARTWNVP